MKREICDTFLIQKIVFACVLKVKKNVSNLINNTITVIDSVEDCFGQVYHKCNLFFYFYFL